MHKTMGAAMNVTIRATFIDHDGTQLQMIFGDSYKKWFTQLVEFTYLTYGDKSKGWRRQDVKGRLIKVEKCKERFRGSTLKWCQAKNYQSELDTEPNASGRKYDEMVFVDSPYHLKRARAEIAKYW